MKKTLLPIVYLILYLPIFIVILFSFNSAHHSLLWHGFSWHWYHVLANDIDVGTTVMHSLEIGLLAATIATIFGSVASITFYRYRFFGKSPMNLLIFLLIIVPDLILAIGWLLTFLLLHITLGFWSLLIAHVSFCIPFVFITVNGRMNGLDKNLVEASQDLGASEWRILTGVLLPILRPALIAGWLLSFTLSIDDTIISYFVTGPDYQTLPLKIYAMVKVGVNPEINALCTLLFIFTIIMIAIVHFTTRRAKK